jgi:hypothetical protein
VCRKTHFPFAKCRDSPPTPADDVGKRLDLNYTPSFPWPWFSEKNLFLSPEHVILCAHLFWFCAPPNRWTDALDVAKRDVPSVPFWAQLIEKKSENVTSRGVILCDPAVKEKNQTWNKTVILKKNIHEMSYHIRSSMTFKSNGLSYGQWTCIVCRNESISRTCVCRGMGINSMCGVFPHGHGKSVLHFPSAETGFFVKRVQGSELGSRETHE